jgi:hypothetical protein
MALLLKQINGVLHTGGESFNLPNQDHFLLQVALVISLSADFPVEM